jgi:hypothetical protein
MGDLIFTSRVLFYHHYYFHYSFFHHSFKSRAESVIVKFQSAQHCVMKITKIYDIL